MDVSDPSLLCIKFSRCCIKYDRLVDVHCNENRGDAGAGGPAGRYSGAYTARLFRLLKQSGINFVANPLVNAHLHGRFDDYLKCRGVTRVKEMNAGGNSTYNKIPLRLAILVSAGGK
ncbi:MAG: hypothetical protein GPOALKHO_001167 [Sodalis sp.]|nr:MAG: hypothetical protein GPOALKHO_001167 [Sodalis sp.]